MADEPRVISATFHTYRPVAGRRVLQLIFEVPLEEDARTLATLGYPNVAEPKWYAIARLKEKPGAEPIPPQGGSSKPERSLAERCAILCQDKRFLGWLSQSWGHALYSPEIADQAIKKRLRIASKTELNEGSPNFNAEAAANFKLLLMTYEAHQADKDYADVRR